MQMQIQPHRIDKLHFTMEFHCSKSVIEMALHEFYRNLENEMIHKNVTDVYIFYNLIFIKLELLM